MNDDLQKILKNRQNTKKEFQNISIAHIIDKSFEKWFNEIETELRTIKEECFLTDEELAELIMVEFHIHDVDVPYAMIKFKENKIK